MRKSSHTWSCPQLCLILAIRSNLGPGRGPPPVFAWLAHVSLIMQGRPAAQFSPSAAAAAPFAPVTPADAADMPLRILGDMVREDPQERGSWLIDMGVDWSHPSHGHRWLRSQKALQSPQDVLDVLLRTTNAWIVRGQGNVANLAVRCIISTKWLIAAEKKNAEHKRLLAEIDDLRSRISTLEKMAPAAAAVTAPPGLPFMDLEGEWTDPEDACGQSGPGSARSGCCGQGTLQMMVDFGQGNPEAATREQPSKRPRISS